MGGRFQGFPVVRVGDQIAEAARVVVKEELVSMGGDGGIIAVDPAGNIALTFNTAGMYRASIDIHGNMDALEAGLQEMPRDDVRAAMDHVHCIASQRRRLSTFVRESSGGTYTRPKTNSSSTHSTHLAIWG